MTAMKKQQTSKLFVKGKGKPVATPAPKAEGTLTLAAREILPKLKAGETTLSAERDRLGLKGNGALRKALIAVMGGKQAYHEMMKAHAPTFQKGVPAPTVSDEKVPVITSTKTADGWGSRMITVRGYTEPVFISPEGKEYVAATANQRADLIVDLRENRLGHLHIHRLKLLEKSTLLKQAKKDAAMVEQGEKARAEKRAKKVRRKSRAA